MLKHQSSRPAQLLILVLIPPPILVQVLEPALAVPEPVKLICSEGKFADLLAQLALHRLDLVIADEPLSRRISVKAFNHPLGQSTISFFCAPVLKSRLQGEFPQCLNGMPMLLQGAAASVRQQFEGWLVRHQLHPLIIGEFDDVALMKAFGREGTGIFMAPFVLEAETIEQFDVELIGRSDELVEEFYAISVERRVTHPCVVAITDAARGQLFVTP